MAIYIKNLRYRLSVHYIYKNMQYFFQIPNTAVRIINILYIKAVKFLATNEKTNIELYH